MRAFLNPDLHGGHLCNFISVESPLQTKRNNSGIMQRELLHSNCGSDAYASSSNIPRIRAIKKQRRRLELISMELS